MPTYTNEELKAAVGLAIDTDVVFRDQVAAAVTTRNRGWLAELIIGVAREWFGFEIGTVVERVIDWFSS
jgi:hypothetical protein